MTKNYQGESTMIPREMQLKIYAKTRELGIRQTDIARQLGVHPSNLNQMLTGLRKPTPIVAQYFAQLLGVTVEELFKKPAA